jgi:hypothetical protein
MSRSKKEVEAILSGMGVFVAIISYLVELVKKFGGTMENIYRLATPEGRKTLEAIAKLIVDDASAVESAYLVAMDYALSIEELVRFGKYDWANSDITSKHFSTKRTGKVGINVKLIHFNRVISSYEALREMDNLGYRPAEACELLAFGAKYPDVQREFPIIALGSVWQRLDGARYVLYLFRDDAERYAYLAWFGSGWGDRCRFAAVHK